MAGFEVSLYGRFSGVPRGDRSIGMETQAACRCGRHDGENAADPVRDERKRLSIYEQFMFPFQPVIDRIKARRSKSAPVPS